MEYRILGRTGLRVSAVALGCEGFIHKTPEEVCADAFKYSAGAKNVKKNRFLT